jgi:hypothetical protein
MFADHDAPRASSHTRRHQCVVADAVQVMKRMVAPRMPVIVDADARFHMITGPSEGAVAAADIVGHTVHAGQHGAPSIWVRDVLPWPHGRRRYCARDGHLDKCGFVGAWRCHSGAGSFPIPDRQRGYQ